MILQQLQKVNQFFLASTAVRDHLKKRISGYAALFEPAK
jgi:hypothetical protein